MIQSSYTKPAIASQICNFSTYRVDPRDAQILYRTTLGRFGAGIIREIFVFQEKFLVIQELQAVSADEGLMQLYRKYKGLDIGLYYKKPSTEFTSLKLADVMGHFTSFPYNHPVMGPQDIIILTTLFRVSRQFFFLSFFLSQTGLKSGGIYTFWIHELGFPISLMVPLVY